MPGLQRIILIDTHLPDVVELKLNGHTNICGTNASGKTTLQRLVPVFYGERPSQVVPSTRDRFERWYLPRESSFIIYEYQRADDELCQVVLASGGTGVNYRLVAKPFDLEDYTYQNQAGDNVIVTMKELARILKRNHIQVSRLLNTKEYRAILQNDKAVLNMSSDSRELLGYARMFTMCSGSGQLRHIEKLAKAVHSKEGKMETIKAMIAAILEEDGVQPPSDPIKRDRVEEWIKECQLSKEFAAIRPEFTALQQSDLQLQQAEQRLVQLQRQYAADMTELSGAIEQQEFALKDTQMQLQLQENQWNTRRDELNQSISSAKADVDNHEANLQQVEDEYQQWLDMDIEQLQEHVQKLPQAQNDLQQADTRYTLLTEKHQDVQSEYNKQKADLTEQLNSQLELLDAQRQEQQEQLQNQQEQQNAAVLGLKEEQQQAQSLLQQEFDQQNNGLLQQKAELKAVLDSAGFSEFEQSQLDLQDATIKEASIQEDLARDQLQEVQRQARVAKKARDDASHAFDNSRSAYQKRQEKLQEIQALLYPGQHSLLEFLRRESPDWPSQFGKVVRPELLAMTDLKPGLLASDVAEAAQGIFGVTLDLSGLDVPDYAQSEAELQDAQQQAQEALTEALALQDEAEAALGKANQALRNAELQVSQAESECKTTQAARQRAQQERETLQKEYAQAVSERKRQTKQRLEQNKAEQQKLASQHQQAKDELRQQQGEAENEVRFHWQQLLEDSKGQISQTLQQIAHARMASEQQKKQLDAWLSNELDARGVDVDEIGELRRQIEDLKRHILETKTNEPKVAEYQRWYQTIFNGRKLTWQKSLAAAAQLLSKSERELQAEKSQYKQKQQSLKTQQVHQEQELRTTREHDQDIQALHKSLQKLALSKLGVDDATDMAMGNYGQRISEGKALLRDREELLADIRSHVEHFDQLIAQQAGTGFFETWERSREESSVMNAQGVRVVDHRKLVGHLDRLLNEIVPQRLHALSEQGRIFGANLTRYYMVLKDIDKRIATQSRRITKEVDDELFLDGVSDSAVKICSKISELEFWPELAAFHQLYEEWLATGANDLPSDDYAQSMRQVMDIFGRSALSGNISRLLDIELHLREGNSDLVIRSDRQLNESSSHGMAYLILCKFLLAFTRLLRGDNNVVVHWPIDELGTLHHNNIKKIFDACQNNTISVVGAFPNPESEVLTLFDNRYLIDKATRRLQVVQPKVSRISLRLQQQRQQQEEARS